VFENVHVMPNHHLISKAFSMSDNFYCDSDASIHGHHWMMGVIPNEWVETNSSVSKQVKYFLKLQEEDFQVRRVVWILKIMLK
jgi:hypothetical protein